MDGLRDDAWTGAEDCQASAHCRRSGPEATDARTFSARKHWPRLAHAAMSDEYVTTLGVQPAAVISSNTSNARASCIHPNCGSKKPSECQSLGQKRARAMLITFDALFPSSVPAHVRFTKQPST